MISDDSTLIPLVDKLEQHSRLGQAEISALMALPCKIADIDAGVYLVREGDRASSCIVLLSGFLYRSKISGMRERQILSVHLRGDIVDLQNVLLDEADHNVQALTQAAVAYIPHQAIVEVSAAFPAVSRAFWRDTLVDGSVFREWTLNIGRRHARQRIAHLLCELATRQEAIGLCKGPRYQWPMTQEQIGDATGMTTVHVNRTLQAMRADGLITMAKPYLIISDWRRLQAEGDFSRAYLHLPSLLAA